MHGLPVFGYNKTISEDAKSKLMFVLDVAPPEEPNEESSFRYQSSNVKLNEPPKIFSAHKETGFDYFAPVMKYRG